MGYTWRANGDGTAQAIECETFAEIVFEEGRILVVNVAMSVARDAVLSDALMDAIARNEEPRSAESAISALAGSFGLEIHPVNDGTQRVLTLAPNDEATVHA